MKTKTYRVINTKSMKALAVKEAVNTAMTQLGAASEYTFNTDSYTLEVSNNYSVNDVVAAVEKENGLKCKLLVSAYAKHIRISPRKVKIVLDLIRGKDAGMAMAILKNTKKGACEHLIKLLGSAIANAENNFHLDSSELYVAECFVTPGPTLKRIMPRAKGSADRILKRTSHITITVAEKN